MPFTGAISKVNHGTLHERVYEELKQALIAGHLKPGEVVTIRPLAQELGTSVVPVRDALLRLAAERALVLLPNRSIRVPRMTRVGFEELYRIRTKLEGMATEMAARAINDAEIGMLEVHHAAILRAVDNADAGEWQKARRDFYFTIYGAARSVHLLPMIESMWLQSGPIQTAPIRRAIEGDDVPIRNWGRLTELVDALRRRNEPAALSAIEQAFEDAVAWYRASYEFDKPENPDDPL